MIKMCVCLGHDDNGRRGVDSTPLGISKHGRNEQKLRLGHRIDRFCYKARPFREGLCQQHGTHPVDMIQNNHERSNSPETSLEHSRLALSLLTIPSKVAH